MTMICVCSGHEGGKRLPVTGGGSEWDWRWRSHLSQLGQWPRHLRQNSRAGFPSPRYPAFGSERSKGSTVPSFVLPLQDSIGLVHFRQFIVRFRTVPSLHKKSMWCGCQGGLEDDRYMVSWRTLGYTARQNERIGAMVNGLSSSINGRTAPYVPYP